MYDPADWYLALDQEGEPECVAFVGFWPNDIDQFEAQMLGVCEALPDFAIGYSQNQRGMFLVRRRPLRNFLRSPDQRSAILDFLMESHRQVVESVRLPVVYDLYLSHARGDAAR